MINKPYEQSLAKLVKRGGVYHDVPGENQKELLAQFIEQLPPIPGIEHQELYREILEREALVSTGIGRGIALPHPRNPILGEEAKPFVAIAFPVQALDWNTQDGSKVHTVFLIVSSSVKQHLNTLSNINFLCRQEQFHSLITSRASKEDIIAAIQEAEDGWARIK